MSRVVGATPRTDKTRCTRRIGFGRRTLDDRAAGGRGVGGVDAGQIDGDVVERDGGACERRRRVPQAGDAEARGIPDADQHRDPVTSWQREGLTDLTPEPGGSHGGPIERQLRGRLAVCGDGDADYHAVGWRCRDVDVDGLRSPYRGRDRFLPLVDAQHEDAPFDR